MVRLRLLVRRIGRDRRVAAIQGIASGVDAAGGPLIASGLAFTALFAILPALLFLTGVSGFVIADAERRAALVLDLLERFPPLAGPIISDTIEGIARGAGGFSLLGLIGLAWAASNLFGALDEVMARLFPGGRTRSLVERRLLGLLTVALVIVVAGLQLTLNAFRRIEIAGLEALGSGGTLGWLMSLIATALVFSLAVLVVYRFVPTAPPSVRAALPPALVTGTAISLLTELFATIATRVVGALAAFGVLTALFAALVWLSWVFQLLLFGGSWARSRRDREEGRVTVVRTPAAR